MRPYLVPLPVKNRSARFFLWASKTDLNLIAPCSHWARETQLAQGYFVAFTAAAAFAGMWSALRSFGAPVVIAPAAALAWAGFVFFLDREITGSFDKGTIWVRAALAIILSLTIAIPLELAIFQGRVDQYLDRASLDTNKQARVDQRNGEVRLQTKRDELQRTLESEEQKVAEWGERMDAEAAGHPGQGRTGQAGAGPVYRNAQIQQEDARRRAAQTRQDIDQLDRSMSDERQRLRKDFERDSVKEVKDFVTRFEALEHVKAESESVNFLSWLITLTLIVIDLTPVLMKLKKCLSDYAVLVRASMDGNIALITAIRDVYGQTIKADPLKPALSIEDLFTIGRHAPVDGPQSEADHEDREDEDADQDEAA